MSNYRRPRVPGASIFFTVNLARPGSDLLIREIDRLRGAVRVARTLRPFAIDAWVTLPDHIHAVWTLPDGDSDYATRWASIKATFSRGMPAGPQRRSQARRREKAIWQRRFWEHHIRCEAEFQALTRYCWANPVRHGLVRRAADWPYTSLPRDMHLATEAPLWADRAAAAGFDFLRPAGTGTQHRQRNIWHRPAPAAQDMIRRFRDTRETHAK